MGDKVIKKSVCRMCGGGCGIDCIIEDGKLVKIKGNPDDLFNRGRLCIKGSSAVANINHPDRLKTALKRRPMASLKSKWNKPWMKSPRR